MEDMKELDSSLYGLDANQPISSNGLLYNSNGSIQTLSDVKSFLESIYCGSTSVDFSAVEVITNHLISSFYIFPVSTKIYEFSIEFFTPQSAFVRQVQMANEGTLWVI